MAFVKIFNDPVYGFITVPSGILLELIEHPFLQRLQRIKQLGLSHYVYPGAVHSRFHHALGAYHLMTIALNQLRLKGVSISDEEYTAAQIAILLHDIGHGPFSHVLEHTILPVPHEEITALMMDRLNREFDDRLALAIRIFRNQYDRPFLHQLISSQLDTDRLDYLTRDSFFTGVAEGVIGYDRLILMMDVSDQRLVLEEKAVYSIEKFLTSRKIMYLQVYMHKTAIAAEYMLNLFLSRFKAISNRSWASRSLSYFLDGKVSRHTDPEEFLPYFASIDDVDIWSLLKEAVQGPDPMLRFLAGGLINRRLFRISMKDENFEAPSGSTPPPDTGLNAAEWDSLRSADIHHFEITPYEQGESEIWIRHKAGSLLPFSSLRDMDHLKNSVSRYYRVEPR